VLLSRAGRSASLRHAERLDKICGGSIQSPCMHSAAKEKRASHQHRLAGQGRRAHLLTTKEAAPTDA
jgi:hypothetical protein